MRKLLRYFYWDVFFAVVFGLGVLAALVALWIEHIFLGAFR